MNDGKIMHADITSPEGNTAAVVIALTPDNKVVIARQFRCGPEKVLDELPGGLVEPDETPMQAIRREMAEEIGYGSEYIELLGTSYINAWDSTMHYYFLARNCYQVDAVNADEWEEVQVDTISISQLLENARTAKMTDVQGVFLAYDRLRELEETNP